MNFSTRRKNSIRKRNKKQNKEEIVCVNKNYRITEVLNLHNVQSGCKTKGFFYIRNNYSNLKQKKVNLTDRLFRKMFVIGLEY